MLIMPSLVSLYIEWILALWQWQEIYSLYILCPHELL